MQTSLSILSLIAVASAVTTTSFVETVSGTTSFVPYDATINADNKLVYKTIVDGTETTVSTDEHGWLSTVVKGGHETTTTADHNYAVETFVHTTTHDETMVVGYGEYYTTTTYDDKGEPKTVYVKNDINIKYTSTTYDNDGHPHTIYISASTQDGTTSYSTITTEIDGLTAASPTTDTAMQKEVSTSSTSTSSNGVAAAATAGSFGAIALGFIACFL